MNKHNININWTTTTTITTSHVRHHYRFRIWCICNWSIDFLSLEVSDWQNSLFWALQYLPYEFTFHFFCCLYNSAHPPSSMRIVIAMTSSNCCLSWDSCKLSTIKLGSSWIWNKDFLSLSILISISNSYQQKAPPHSASRIWCSRMTTRLKGSCISYPLVSQGSCN